MMMKLMTHLIFGLLFVLGSCQMPEDETIPADQRALSSSVTMSYNINTVEAVVDASDIYILASISKNNFTFSVSPSLPVGLYLDPSTGLIYGTPLVVSAAADYTVTASDGTESVSDVINIEVTGIIPVALVYPNDTFEFTVGVVGTSGTPYVVGTYDSITSPDFDFTLYGLALDTLTGEITGTPTNYYEGSVEFKVTNAWGDYYQRYYLIIHDLPPTALALTNNSQSVNINTPITAMVASYSDALNVTFSVSPPLPTGVTLNTTTGGISGTPTVEIDQTTYTVFALNNEGFDSFDIDLEVTDPPLTLTYTPVAAAPRYRVITAVTPAYTGGQPTSYTEDAPGCLAALGLSLNPNNGIVYGTPTAVVGNYTCDISGTRKSSAPVTGTFDITITAREYTMDYAEASYKFDIHETVYIEPTITGYVTGVTYSVLPALPAGLTLDTNTGVITGLETAPVADAAYVITADDGGAIATDTINIEIENIKPGSPGYDNAYIFYTTLPLNNVVPSPDPLGGVPTSYSISPLAELPPGLVFDTNTGEISGTPTEPYDNKIFTITATNAEGSTQQTVQIWVKFSPPIALNYDQAAYSFTIFTGPETLTPTYYGPSDVVFSVNPELPDGLVLNTATGLITGTPTEYTSTTQYQVVATNQYGRIAGGFTIEVANLNINGSGVIYTETPTNNELNFIKGTLGTKAPDNPGHLAETHGFVAMYCLDDGTVTMANVSDTLPTGLTFNEETGVFAGVASAATIPGELNGSHVHATSPSMQYVIAVSADYADCAAALTAAAGGADHEAITVQIAVLDPVPNFFYFSDDTESEKFVIPLGESLTTSPIAPTFAIPVATQENGGAFVTLERPCDLDADGEALLTALGGNYTFDDDTCTFEGDITVNGDCSTYDGETDTMVVTGYSSGGSSTANLELLFMVYPNEHTSPVTLDGNGGTNQPTTDRGVAACDGGAFGSTYSLTPSLPTDITFSTTTGEIDIPAATGMYTQTKHVFQGERTAHGHIAKVNQNLEIKADYVNVANEELLPLIEDFNSDGKKDILLLENDDAGDPYHMFTNETDGFFKVYDQTNVDSATTTNKQDPQIFRFGSDVGILYIGESGGSMRHFVDDLDDATALTPVYTLSSTAQPHLLRVEESADPLAVDTTTTAFVLRKLSATNVYFSAYRAVENFDVEFISGSNTSLASSGMTGTGTTLYDMQAIDINNDSYADVAIAFDDTVFKGVCIMVGVDTYDWGTKCTTLRPLTEVTFPNAPPDDNVPVYVEHPATQILFADLIDDGQKQLEMIALDDAKNLYIYKNLGNFTFELILFDQTQVDFADPRVTGKDLAIADADMDGDLDVIVAAGGSDNDFWVYRNSNTPVPFGNGTGQKFMIEGEILSAGDDISNIKTVPEFDSNGLLKNWNILACGRDGTTTATCGMRDLTDFFE
jgi:hypothetical protein